MPIGAVTDGCLHGPVGVVVVAHPVAIEVQAVRTSYGLRRRALANRLTSHMTISERALDCRPAGELRDLLADPDLWPYLHNGTQLPVVHGEHHAASSLVPTGLVALAVALVRGRVGVSHTTRSATARRPARTLRAAAPTNSAADA